jgi:hypothetical protein
MIGHIDRTPSNVETFVVHSLFHQTCGDRSISETDLQDWTVEADNGLKMGIEVRVKVKKPPIKTRQRLKGRIANSEFSGDIGAA